MSNRSVGVGDHEGAERRYEGDLVRRVGVREAAQGLSRKILSGKQMSLDETVAIALAALVDELGGPRPMARIAAAKELREFIKLIMSREPGGGGVDKAIIEALSTVIDGD